MWRGTNGSPAVHSGLYICRLPYLYTLQVEYAEREKKYGILFIFTLIYEFSNLEYVRVPVEYRVNVAKNVIRIVMAASQEYVNTIQHIGYKHLPRDERK